MMTLTKEAWAAIQHGCDDCAICRGDAGLDTKGAVPGRPWWPECQGRLLLVSEAPPVTGGFWRTGQYDDLREHLFCILQGLGCRFPNDLHSDVAIRSFLAENLFLLRTVKWPLAKGNHKWRPNFNRLRPHIQDTLVTHTTATHLGPELVSLAPKAVLAMGTAAWRACGTFVRTRTDLHNLRVTAARGQVYEMAVENQGIPLDVTLLPVGQNMRRPVDAATIREDIGIFFRRYRGTQLGQGDSGRASVE